MAESKTDMATITKLTEAQEAEIPRYISKWIAKASEPTDREAATKVVKAMYTAMKEEEPIVIFGPSPFSTAVMAAMFFELVKGGKFEKKKLRSQLYSQLGSQLYSQLDSQLRSQLYSQLYSQLGSINSDWYMGTWWLAWAGWYDYGQYIGVKFGSKAYELFMAFVSNVGFIIPYKGVAFVSEAPTSVIWDDSGRLHYDQGKAVAYGDGWGMYNLQGVNFKEELYWKIVEEAITAEEVMQIENAEQRMAAISMLKPDELLKQLKAELTHTGIKGTKLYEVKNFMDTGDTEYCMLMVCPSTGRNYVEWVPPSVGKKGDADLCQAEAFGIPVEDYLMAVEA